MLRNGLPPSFAASYRQSLRDYIFAEAGEDALMQAYELGRKAVNDNCNIIDLVAMHQDVMLQTVLSDRAEEPLGERLRRSEQYLAEVMAPLEMMHRGYNDTIRQLQEVNANLEERVEKRTRDLQDSQRKAAALARIYHILSSINSAIVRLQDRVELFRETCRVAVNQGGYELAWIHLFGDSASSSTDTWCRLMDDSPCFSEPIRLVAPGVKEDMQRIHRQAKPIVRHDRPERVVAREDIVIDYSSYALLPLLLDDTVIGVFGLFSTRPKDFDDDEMRLLVELAGDISFALDHIHKEKQLNYLAYYDALTGLPNRNLLLEHLPLQFKSAMRVDSLVALLLVELTHFSDISDTYGRHIGDNLLRQVSDRLRRTTGNREIVAKVGIDRFALTLTGAADADQVAHRLEAEVLQVFERPFETDSLEIYLTIGVGISIFPSDSTDPERLYTFAEMALKRAQAKGEDYLLYNPAMNERIVHSVTMEAKLRKAIEKQRLVLNYQPKIKVDGGEIAGLEVLVRYDDPEEGLILPGRFIPLMEGTGMIVEIGNFVIRRVVEDLQRWRDMGLAPPRTAVNFSAYQLRQKNFVDSLVGMLPSGGRESGLDMELTESALMEDIEENIPKLHAVRELGMKIAIDDFGTGYSSLSYLCRLPINTLKIDRSFIIDMTERPNSMSLVSTIITLAHSLDLDVVAEGVDSEDQAKLLRLLRCDFIQGNLHSPPLTFTQMTAMLQRGAGR